MPSSQVPVELFYIYSDKDKELLDELEKHLIPLKNDRLISSTWYEGLVVPGSDREKIINANLDSASIILLLISADFFDSRNHCVRNMQYALKRNAIEETCVIIPILLRSVIWKDSLFARLQHLPKDARFVTARDKDEWDAAFTEIAEGIRDVVKALPNRLHPPVTPLPPDQQERMNVIKRVRKIWIQGALTNRLYNATSIQPHLQYCSGMVVPLSPEIARMPPRELTDAATIEEVYTEASHQLLILGKPLAGKTTLLLELARTLLDKAEKDKSEPIPIVFDLSLWSSWAESEKKAKRFPLLREWLIKQLCGRMYDVPRKIGENWLENDRVILLLDGLDKVAKNTRNSCIQSINDYIDKHGKSAMVVCCRSKEYEEYKELEEQNKESKKSSSRFLLMLLHAVSIRLPLTSEQVTVYFEQLFNDEKHVKEVNSVIKENKEISDILYINPYVVCTFLSTYQGKSSGEMQETVFGKYIDLIIPNQTSLKREKVIKYLAFLAKHMAKPEHRAQYEDKAFVVEHLRPTWLTPGLKIVYRVCVVLLVGVLVGMFVGMLVELFFGSPLGFFCGLFCGLAIGWEVGRDTIIKRKEILSLMLDRIRKRWKTEQKRGKTFGVLFLGWIGWVVGSVILLVLELFKLFASQLVCLLVELKDSVNLAGQVWEWKRARLGSLIGLGVGLIVGLVFDQFYGLNGGPVFGQDGGLLGVVVFVLFWMLAGGLVGGLIGGGFWGGFSRIRPPSGEDIRRSAQNSLFFGFFMGLFFACVGGVIIGPVFGLVLGLVGALIVALIFGLDAFVQHFIVYFLLWSRGHVPRKFTTFLDDSVEWSLLQKGDKGYTFEPPQLFEYFANRPLETEEKKGCRINC